MNSNISRRAGAALVSAAVLAATLNWAYPAQAVSAITCTGAGTLTWSRALPSTETSEGWSATTAFSNCAGVGADGDATAPTTLTLSGNETADCTGPVSGDAATGTITWGDGTTGTGTESEVIATEVGGNGAGIFKFTIQTGSHHVGQAMLETPAGQGGSCGETSLNYNEVAVLAQG